MATTPHTWQRAIILVDMNAFFASVEQLDHPELRGQPIAITNGAQGTCIITCSYEARAYGIKTGMRWPEAIKLCPHLIKVPSNPYRYTEVSTNIMQALMTVTPDVEVYSIDEAFLDVTHCQTLWGSPETIGRLVKQKVFEASKLLCSVGVSSNKSTAKYAAKVQKPNGFTVIPQWEIKARLKDVAVTEISGIARGIGKFLAQYGVYTCGDMEKLPISILAQRFGNVGRRIWLMCQGLDHEEVQTKITAPKSMGHGKVMPPNTRDKATLLIYLLHMCEKLATRLRAHSMQAQHFYIGWLSHEGWLGAKTKLPAATQDGKVIYKLGQSILNAVWQGQPVYQIQVTGLDPQPQYEQYDLFIKPNPKREQLLRAIDGINQRYGEFTVAPTPLLNRSAMHNVIAPSWKPSGHRQTL